MFQNLWSRHLHQVFGATGVAVSTVVTVFMVGLGGGAYLAGRLLPRIRRPLRAYAVAELGIAGWALVVPWLLRPHGWLATVNAWLKGELLVGGWGLAAGRFVAVLPVLIPPTVLMGATLPLLVAHFVASDGQGRTQPHAAPGTDNAQARRRVAQLYGINTLGAVAGVGTGAFVLLPNLGAWQTNMAALSVNLLLGVGILAYDRYARRPASGEGVDDLLAWESAQTIAAKQPPAKQRRPQQPRGPQGRNAASETGPLSRAARAVVLVDVRRFGRRRTLLRGGVDPRTCHDHRFVGLWFCPYPHHVPEAALALAASSRAKPLAHRRSGRSCAARFASGGGWWRSRRWRWRWRYGLAAMTAAWSPC